MLHHWDRPGTSALCRLSSCLQQMPCALGAQLEFDLSMQPALNCLERVFVLLDFVVLMLLLQAGIAIGRGRVYRARLGTWTVIPRHGPEARRWTCGSFKLYPCRLQHIGAPDLHIHYTHVSRELLGQPWDPRKTPRPASSWGQDLACMSFTCFHMGGSDP